MTILDVRATSERFNMTNGTIEYQTDIRSTDGKPGVLLLTNDAIQKDLIIMNQYYEGYEPLVVVMKTIHIPAAKYKVGDVIAKLVLFG